MAMGIEAAVSFAARRIFHFGAGPAMLPPEVLAEIREELPDFRGSGISILELGHRTPAFQSLMREIEDDLRRLMGVPDDYAVIFMQGGAALQFATIPLNLGSPSAYLVTGHWSLKALREAERVAQAQAVWDGTTAGYTSVPAADDWKPPEQAAYLHYTVNETIAGVEFHTTPANHSLPLVADMTSMILARPVEVSKHAVIYASAQKNLGVAGITVIILDPRVLRPPSSHRPSLLDYHHYIETGSLPNTPPVFAWYVLGKMLKWTQSQGGPEALAVRNRRKAELLYGVVDATGFYINRVEKSCRSWMNVPFRLNDTALEPVFLQEAERQGLKYLAGHRSSGGVRASIYNAMPEAGVVALAGFMREFERRHG